MYVPNLIVHHSGPGSKRAITTRDDIDHFQKNELGWKNGIVYHTVIEANGVLKVGREIGGRKQGHSPGTGRNSLGVILCGNFEIEVPDMKQVKALKKVLVDWCITYSVHPTKIYSHREAPGANDTKCCGKYLIAMLPVIKQDVIKEVYEIRRFTDELQRRMLRPYCPRNRVY